MPLHQVQAEYANAELLYLQALAIMGRTLDPDHSDVATALASLAELYRATGRMEEADAIEQRLEEIQAADRE